MADNGEIVDGDDGNEPSLTSFNFEEYSKVLKSFLASSLAIDGSPSEEQLQTAGEHLDKLLELVSLRSRLYVN